MSTMNHAVCIYMYYAFQTTHDIRFSGHAWLAASALLGERFFCDVCLVPGIFKILSSCCGLWPARLFVVSTSTDAAFVVPAQMFFHALLAGNVILYTRWIPAMFIW